MVNSNQCLVLIQLMQKVVYGYQWLPLVYSYQCLVVCSYLCNMKNELNDSKKKVINLPSIDQTMCATLIVICPLNPVIQYSMVTINQWLLLINTITING